MSLPAGIAGLHHFTCPYVSGANKCVELSEATNYPLYFFLKKNKTRFFSSMRFLVLQQSIWSDLQESRSFIHVKASFTPCTWRSGISTPHFTLNHRLRGSGGRRGSWSGERKGRGRSHLDVLNSQRTGISSLLNTFIPLMLNH